MRSLHLDSLSGGLKYFVLLDRILFSLEFEREMFLLCDTVSVGLAERDR